MTDGEAYRKLGTIAQRWRDLAERRRVHFTEMYETGRWKKYYGEDRLLLRMREVVAAADGWQTIVASFGRQDAQIAAPPSDPDEATVAPTDRAAA